MNIEWSFDDGLSEDIIIANVFRKHRLKNVVFYIPNNTELLEPEIKELSEDFEVGGHTVNHYPDLKRLPDKLLKAEIIENKKWLENITGKEVNKFCYPRGRWDERVMFEVANAGYKEARTTIVLKTDYGLFNKDTTVHFYPRKEYKIANKSPFQIAKYFVASYKEGEVLRFWGHSNELLHIYGINALEDLIKFIKNI